MEKREGRDIKQAGPRSSTMLCQTALIALALSFGVPSSPHLLVQITGAAPPEDNPAAEEDTVAQEGEDDPAVGMEAGDDTEGSPEIESAVAGR